jgi:hypothetical protein
VRKDGQTLTVNLVSTASYDTNGTIVGFLAVATDVTARAQAEKARQEAEDQLGPTPRLGDPGLAGRYLGLGYPDWAHRLG